MPVPPFGISRYKKPEEGVCPVCGSTDFVEGDEDYEEIWEPVTLAAGLMFPGAHPERVTSVGEDGVEIVETRYVPTKVPYFKPGKYPVIPRRNVSVFGRLLGDSDVDKLLSHQNAINRVHKEIIDKLMQGGCFGTIPDNVKFTDQGGFKVLRLTQQDRADQVGVYNLEAPVGQDMEYLNELYKEAQQAIGVTDAFLGRKDPTASSGKAKELSAAQAAGRMESKRVMKRAAFADLYELMFLFELAYADEPFSVLSKDADGKVVYDSFDRRMFIERDEATGEYRYNTQFLFDVDESSALASNREAMWQELRMNLQTGAFGNPQDPASLVTFWALMEENHYPGAGTIKKKFEEIQAKAEAAAAAQAQAAMMQQAGGVPGGVPAPGVPAPGGAPGAAPMM